MQLTHSTKCFHLEPDIELHVYEIDCKIVLSFEPPCINGYECKWADWSGKQDLVYAGAYPDCTCPDNDECEYYTGKTLEVELDDAVFVGNAFERRL